ncbi:MAG: fused MFS/spermidine synthase [Candidatus Zixiibacteriota bacterium]|nr:MAG: fused MFS/spermidine synthase [candidate division Zixibacteria bacterium]
MTVSVVGGAPFAVATILTVFMGGLGLGSYIASRTIDRIKQPLKLVRLYGILELLIGVYGLAFPLLLLVFKPIYAVIYNQLFEHFMLYNLLTFVATSILLLVPVTLMGATLPILCRFYVTRLGHLGTHAGRLYGLNTIGAAAGSLLCGFWLISLLGIWGTLAVAVVINAIIGIVTVLASYRMELPEFDYEGNKDGPDGDLAKPRQEYRGAVVGALIIFAVSGYCAMAYEVIWTKLLGLVVGPTTYSFTIVLVTFIVGLAFGSIFFGWLADRTRNTIRLLIGTQIAAALFALGASQVLGSSQLYFAKLIFVFQDQFTLRTLLKGVSLFVFMILPTLCLGATFPLVGKIYTQSIKKVGHSIGRAYAINTIGAVLGSFMAGFILIPLIGKQNSLSLVIGFQLVTTLAVAILMIVKNREKIARWTPYLAVAVIGTVLCFQYPVFNRHLLSLGKAYRVNDIAVVLRGGGWIDALINGEEILSRIERGELLFFGDGIGGFTTVLRSEYQMGDTHFIMANSGKADASTVSDMCTQTLSAQLPLIFHPNASHVLVVGLGSGVTGGEVLLYPVDRVDMIEINEQVVAASDYFRPWNYNVVDDPRINMIIQDGRAHLELSKETYDAIISEPSNPWMAGLAALFTKEYFELAKEALNDGGIFVQFIHSYRMDWSAFALVGRTFARVFPNSIMVSTAPSRLGPDYLLVGFKGSGGHRLEVAQKNLGYAQRSTNIALSDARLIYMMIVAENLPQLFGDGPINSDASPLLEFAAPKLMYSHGEAIESTIHQRGELGAATEEILRQVSTDVELQLGYTEYALSLFSPFDGMVNLAVATPEQRDRFLELTDNFFASHSTDLNFTVDEALKKRWRAVQRTVIMSEIESLPNKALSYSYLGDINNADDMLDEAVACYLKSLEYDSENEAVQTNLGVALMRQGRATEAVERFERALSINPNLSEAYSNLGHARSVLGDAEAAADNYRKAIEIDPANLMALNNLGLALMQSSDMDGAIELFRKVIRVNPYSPEAHCHLGAALTQTGQYEEAIKHFNEALRLRPDMQQAKEGLERAEFFREVRGQ